MEAIFHEQQEGLLCAQHCLNSLLQGQFYSPVDLAELAQELDSMERVQMAELGDSPEYRQFLQQPSINMDDSGFFSVQVIARALSVWGLELVAYSSSDPLAVRARQSPITAGAYICNYREHWFTIRRLGSQWFNLNSLLEGPELVSNTYLGEFLAQLQQEGYSIFIVKGKLPDCDADLVLQAVPAVQHQPPRLLADVQSSGRGKANRARDSGSSSGPAASSAMGPGAATDEAADIEAALLLSLAENIPGPSEGPATIDDDELQLALAMSRSGDQVTPPAISPLEQVSEEDELQQAISMSLASGTTVYPSSPASSGAGGGVGWGQRLRQQEQEQEERYKQQEQQEQEEEEELRKALALSLQADSKRREEPPVRNVEGVLKHQKLTSPVGSRLNSSVQSAVSVEKSLGPASQQPSQMKPTVRSEAVPTTKSSTAGDASKAGSGASAQSQDQSAATAGRHAAGIPGSGLPQASRRAVQQSGGSAGAAMPQPGPQSGPNSGMPQAGGTAMPPSGGRMLGGGRPSGEADPEEIRRRRLAFLEKMQKEQQQ